MKVFVINDNIQRLQPCLDELRRQQVQEYIIVPGTHLVDNVVRSINLSHKKIVQAAKTLDLPEVCIMEDDVYFPSPHGFQYFLEHKPQTFDLYLAGIIVGWQHDWNPNPKEVKSFAGMHCYIISNQFYDTFLQVEENEHIDKALANKGQYSVCYPFAAIQRPGFSANSRQYEDYNHHYRPQDLYS